MNDGSTACRKRGKDQGGAGPQIGSRHFRPLVTTATRDLHAAGHAVQIRAKSIQLCHVPPTHGKDAVLDEAWASRRRHECRPVGLKIGRQPGVGFGGHAHRKRLAACPHGHTISLHVDGDSARFQRGEKRFQMLGNHAHHIRRAAGNGRGEHQRCRFDAIGNDTVAPTAEPLHSIDFDGRRPQSADPRTEHVQHAAEAGDLRFARRAADDGAAAGEHGGTKHVRRARHRRTARTAEVDCRAAEPCGRAQNIAPLQAQIGAQGGQPAQVQIDRPVTDVAAAGQRHDRPAPPRQQRPKHAKSRPHPPHRSVAGLGRPRVAGSQGQAVAVRGNVDAQVVEQPRHRAHVGQSRNAA